MKSYSPTPEFTTIRMSFSSVNDSPCSVCGKKASGVHYLSLSCNGCRSFFRRSVAFKRNYKCKQAGFDVQDCFLRHRCKQCRFALCLSTGMDPDAVRTEEWSPCAEEVDDLLIHIKQEPMVLQPLPIESKMERMMSSLLIAEEAHDRLRISSYCPQFVEGLTIDDFTCGPSKLGMKFEAMRSQAYQPISVRLVPAEVYIKEKVYVDFTDFDYSAKKLWAFQDIAYSIEFIKSLPIFHLLDACSQRVLIASALTCSNFTAAFYSYSHHSDRTFFPDGTVMSWDYELMDRREYALLKRIIVLNPMLEGLSPHDITLLQHERESCTNMLMSYVLVRRGRIEGPSHFSHLLSVIDVVNKYTSWQKSKHILILAMGLYKYRIPFAESVVHSQ